jgi:ketosteroid isomerase-like protein
MRWRASLVGLATAVVAGLAAVVAGHGQGVEPDSAFDPVAEEKAIREALAQILDAYGASDSKTMASLSDETFMNTRMVRTGREEVEKWWATVFEAWGPTTVHPIRDFGIVFVTPDVAIWRGISEFRDRVDADGNPVPPQQVIGANVWVKRNGRWYRAATFVQPLD